MTFGVVRILEAQGPRCQEALSILAYSTWASTTRKTGFSPLLTMYGLKVSRDFIHLLSISFLTSHKSTILISLAGLANHDDRWIVDNCGGIRLGPSPSLAHFSRVIRRSNTTELLRFSIGSPCPVPPDVLDSVAYVEFICRGTAISF